MKTNTVPASTPVDAGIAEHLADSPAIIEAIRRRATGRAGHCRTLRLADLGIALPADYQRYLCTRFGDIIGMPSFDYLSKAPGSWLMVGDHRLEIAAGIRLLIERYGLGIGMLVLNLQQIRAGHILTSIEEDGERHSLAVPPDLLVGEGGEHILCIPLRRFRSDFERLAALNIAKPAALWNRDNIITHERDAQPCAYCSCAEIHPAEVVVDLDGARHGLSRNYSLGFTFAPFGNPLTSVHFLAWDRSSTPLNMNRVPMTVSDLVKMTREINQSIRSFFAETEVRDFPALDGISNGWAGNTVFHQHFQFFAPEIPLPIVRASATSRPLIRRDDVTVQRLVWPSPAYRIQADESLNTGLVGNDVAGIWRLLGGSRRSPYKKFPPGHTATEEELVPAHTQNVYIPGSALGRTAHLFLRDRERVDYLPGPDDFIRYAAGLRTQAKRNLGVLEVSGSVIMDDETVFATMRSWTPADVAQQVKQMIASTAPEKNKVAEFEAAAAELFPS